MMKILFILLLMKVGFSYGQSNDSQCLNTYYGYMYVVYKNCPPYQSCQKDYFFSYQVEKIEDTFNYTYFIDSCILLNDFFYSNYFMSNYFANDKIKDYYTISHNSKKKHDMIIDQYKVVIFGYTLHEDASAYYKYDITAHEHSALKDRYNNIEKKVHILYPYIILPN